MAFGVLIVISMYSLIVLGSYTQLGHAVLYENGTCTNEVLTGSANSTINTNGTVGDFLKSLPSDNIVLAEIVCNNSFNETK
jgi:hypothetical protein